MKSTRSQKGRHKKRNEREEGGRENMRIDPKPANRMNTSGRKQTCKTFPL